VALQDLLNTGDFYQVDACGEHGKAPLWWG
jgi:hypothetical protein